MKFSYFQNKLFFLLGILFLLSCNTVKYLEEGESLLSSNNIKFAKGSKIKNKSNLEYQLTQYYKQKPNRYFFWVPRQYFYYNVRDSIERSKFWKKWAPWAKKRLGEPPAIFKESYAERSTQEMKYFLQHKGYFWADVSYYFETKRKGKKTDVTYVVSPKGQYVIDSLIFESEDKKIENILKDISDKSFLKKGRPIDIELYKQEVARIQNHLRNEGYAFFLPQYVSNLESLDSADFKIKAKIKIFTPNDQTEHQVYKIGKVTIFPNYGEELDVNQEPDTLINGYYFVTDGKKFRVKPKTLINSISLRTGDLYKEENEDNTSSQLRSLGVFSFVTVKPEKDPEQPGVLNFKLLLTQNKKLELGADFDINNTDRKGLVSNRNLIGLSVSPSVKIRNLFKGGELLVMNADLGMELALFQDTLLNTLDFKVQSDLYYPRFVDYFGIWKGLGNIGLLSKKYQNALKSRANSRFSLSYNRYSLVNFYSYDLFNFSFGYDVQRASWSRFIVNNLGIDFLAPTNFGETFTELLAENPFLDRSFDTQLLTGFLFRDFTYIYSQPLGRTGGAWFFQGALDMSGFEVWAVNKLYNKIAGENKVFDIAGVEFSQYFRADIDVRRYWKPHEKRTFVLRINSGIVVPFGSSSEAPYVKQFYVGGPQSIRGWYARGIGPGSYLDDATLLKRNRNLFYQTGDFKLEWNAEYRLHLLRPFNLFDLNAALFVDGGNVWTLTDESDPDGGRPGAKLEFNNLLNDMAVGGGIGIRMDYTYFIIRLDLGTLLRNNYSTNGTHWVDFSNWNFKDRVAWHFGLGYPF